MSDAADRLAQALRHLINEAVELAIARQGAPGLGTSMPPAARPICEICRSKAPRATCRHRESG